MPSFISRNQPTRSSTRFWPIRRYEPSAAFRYRAIVLGTALVLVLLLATALSLGPYPLAPGDLLAFLMAKATGAASPLSGPAEAVILQIRVPRILAATAVGAALAASGAAYQSLFRNPLVSPDILGVSAGAAFGAVLGIFFSLEVWAIQSLAFVFGLAAVAIAYSIAASLRGHDPILVLVLAGVVLGALLGACIALVKYLADPYNQLPAITYWLLGSLAATNPGDVWSTVLPVLIGLVTLWLLRWRITVLSLGDEEAASLGVQVRRVRVAVIAAATLVTAAVVSISGIIGWIGLIVPHVARLFVGADFRRLLPVAALL